FSCMSPTALASRSKAAPPANASARMDMINTISAIATSSSTRVKPAERVVLRVLTARPFSVGAPVIDLDHVFHQDGDAVVHHAKGARRWGHLQVHGGGACLCDADNAVEISPRRGR